jgi:hypothetical protein
MLAIRHLYLANGACSAFIVSGFSQSVIDNRDALIKSQIESHAPNKESYSLIAKVVNVGIALLVYGRDDGIARQTSDVETAWTGSGPGFMGNKGAVGVRFRVSGSPETAGETYTYEFSTRFSPCFSYTFLCPISQFRQLPFDAA